MLRWRGHSELMASALFNPHSDSNLSHPVFQSRVCRLAFDPELAFHIYPWQLQFHGGGGAVKAQKVESQLSELLWPWPGWNGINRD